MDKPQNVIVWFDVPTEDFDRAKRFYEEVLGHEINTDESTGMKLGLFAMAGKMGVGGGLVPPDPMYKPAEEGSHGVRVYFDVNERIDDALEKAELNGGSIVRPKFWLEMAGWLAVIRDTEGNEVGLWSQGKKDDQ